MIISYPEGKKCTPKQKAEEMFADAIDNKIEYWFEDKARTEGMTQTEKDKLIDQLIKVKKRLSKVLNQ